MKRRPRKQRRTRKPSRVQRAVVPGQWEHGGQALEDPGAGFLEVGMFALNAPDAPPAFRGQAIQTMVFHDVAADEPCPCGSGQAFGDCHRDPERVPLLCRDLDAGTYSELMACETTFHVVDDKAAVRALKAAPELRLTQEISGRLFWQFIGSPPVETPLGDLVFATVEWNPRRLYFVTLSPQRNEVIVRTLVSQASDALGRPVTRRLDVEHHYRQMIIRHKE